MDAQIGQVLDKMEALDLFGNTIIILWGDHGFHLGELGLWAKTTNFEWDTRVPLIMVAPQSESKGKTTNAVVELVDLYPTLTELSGLPDPHQMDGESLLSVLKNPGAVEKGYAFSQFPRPPYSRDEFTTMGYSIRNADSRYTCWVDLKTGAVEAEEFYRYENQQVEQVNLIDRIEESPAIQKLKAELMSSIPMVNEE